MTNLQRAYFEEILMVLYAIGTALFWLIGWKIAAIVFAFFAFVALCYSIKYALRASKTGEL